MKAVRTGIGAAIRTIHSDVLREEVPDKIAELLRQLDQDADTRTSVSTGPHVRKRAGWGPNLQTDLQGRLAEASNGCKIKA